MVTNTGNTAKQNRVGGNPVIFMQRSYRFIILVITMILFMSQSAKAQDIPSWVVYPDAEWETITPEEAGLDVDSWNAYIAEKTAGAYGHPMAGANPDGLHGVVFTRGGYIIDTIGNPDLKTLQSASVGKAFNKIALQLAIDLGYINSANDLIKDYWTGAGQLDRTAKQMDQGFHTTLTFNHLALMKGGFPVSNGYTWNNNSSIPDWANWSGDATYDNYAHRAPGTTYYSSGGMWRLMQALTAITGRDMKEFLDTELFSKIGIKAKNWKIESGEYLQNNKDFYPDWPEYGDFCDPPYTINNKTVYGGGGWVTMSPKDLARIGLLIACRGMWKGERLISDTNLLAGHDGYGNSKLYGNKDNYVAIGMVAMGNIPYSKVDNDINDRVIGDLNKDGGTGNNAPQAVISASATSGTTPLTITFDSSVSSDSDGIITSLDWDFGDGNQSTEPDPIHTFSTAGSYTVSLTVTDDQGAVDSASIVITVSDPGSSTAMNLEAEDSDYSGASLKTDASASAGEYVDFNRSPDSYVDWTVNVNAGSYTAVLKYANAAQVNRDLIVSVNGVDVGIVSLAPTGGDTNWADSDAVTLTFPAGASHIRLTSTSAGPNIDYLSLDGGTQTNAAPQADITASVTSGSAPLSVSFDGTGSSDIDGAIVSYAWDFDDGSQSTQANSSHTFNTAGTYIVLLTVTDDQGATNTASVVITVSDPGSSTAIKLEAEDATISGATIIDDPASSGGQHIDFNRRAGSYLDWTVNVNAGTYTAVLKYASGASVDRVLDVTVNGVAVGSVTLLPTGGWTNWTDSPAISLTLPAGTSNIRFTTTAAGSNIDYLSLDG